jgi:colanic acid biosynthesis glycosyl transferase WcaI
VNVSQKRILLASPFFYPEPISTGKANQHLAEALAAEDHALTVLCSHPLYPTWLPETSQATLPGMTILRGGANVRYPHSMPLRRMVLELWFALYALRRTWKLRRSVDVLVSILPPSLFALCLDRLLPRRVRRVAVIHDLQGVLAAQEKSTARRLIIRMIQCVESRAFQAQDLLIFFSEDMAQAAQRAYRLQPQKCTVQYPFVTIPATASATGSRLASQFPVARQHVVYSGALGYKQNSHAMVRLMQLAAVRHPEIGFHVLSGGPFYEELRAEYERIPGPRVQFHPLVAQQDLPELYARSTIQIIPQAPGTEAGALPSKLPNLLAAGVYLLALCSADSEVGRLLRRAGTGTLVESWDDALFLARLEEALAIVQTESAAARRTRIQPLLPEFQVSNLVAMVTGTRPRITDTPTPEPAPESVVLSGSFRG